MLAETVHHRAMRRGLAQLQAQNQHPPGKQGEGGDPCQGLEHRQYRVRMTSRISQAPISWETMA